MASSRTASATPYNPEAGRHDLPNETSLGRWTSMTLITSAALPPSGSEGSLSTGWTNDFTDNVSVFRRFVLEMEPVMVMDYGGI